MITRLWYRGILILTLALTAAGIAGAQAPPPAVDADSTDWIRSWLLCGPFDNFLAPGVTEYRHDKTTLGFYFDYLEPAGGESGVQPREGASFTDSKGNEWQWKSFTAPGPYIDFCKIYKKNQRTVVYAACTIHAKTACDKILSLGSNDGVKAWLNGRCIWENNRPRGAEKDQDFVPVHLEAGDNLLLVKVSQGMGNWGLYARLLAPETARAMVEKNLDLGDVEVETENNGEKLTVTVGRVSRLCMLTPPPVCTITIQGFGQDKPARTEQGPLGKSLTLPLADLPDGPAKITITTTLADGRSCEKTRFCFIGESPYRVTCYDADGKPAINRMEMLNARYEAVDYGMDTSQTPGTGYILRWDVSPFYLRMLVKTPGLGYRYLLADNGGKGFSCEPGKSFTLDLPREVLRTLTRKLKALQQDRESLPPAQRRMIKRRLFLAHRALKRQPGAKGIYQAISILSTLRAGIPSGNEDVVLWYAPGIEKAGLTEPVPDFSIPAVPVALAKNEYEPFQVVVHPYRDLPDLSVTFDTFRSDTGDTLPAEAFQVRVARYVTIERTSDFFGETGPWPDPLPDLKNTSAPAGKNTPLWITVHTKPDQPAGLYRGTLTICSKGKPVAHTRVVITVFNFALPRETHLQTAYGVSPGFGYYGELTEEQKKQVYDKYMQCCAEHRIAPYTPQRYAPFTITVQGDPPHATVDFTAFDKAMARYLDDFGFTAFDMGGFPSQLGSYRKGSDTYAALFKEVYGAVQQHLKEKGWLDKAYWYWVDEPPKSRYAEVKEGMDFLKAACPGIHRLLTCNQEDAPIPYFFDSVNLWVPIMDRYDETRAHARQQLGETVWWYVCTGPKAPYPNNFIDHPAINHRIRFWMLDAYGLDGSLYWSITYWRQNPWKQAMSVSPSGGDWGNGDGRLLYPPLPENGQKPLVEGPVTSIRFENLRDGLEDDEYLWLLRQRAGDTPEGKALLQAIRHSLVPSKICYEQNPIILMGTRRQVAHLVATHP